MTVFSCPGSDAGFSPRIVWNGFAREPAWRMVAVATAWGALAMGGNLSHADGILISDQPEIETQDEAPDQVLTLAEVPEDLVAEQASAQQESDAGIIQQSQQWNDEVATCGPTWIATVDALMLWQGSIPSRAIFEEQATDTTALNANQLDPAMAAGPRFGLIRRLGDVNSIEGNYFNVRSLKADGALPAAGGPFALQTLPPFTDIQAADVLTNAQIQSAELNWRRWNSQSITWLAGFRWVEWNEQLKTNYAFESDVAAGTGYYDASAGNNLYGGQIGADVQLWNAGKAVRVNAVGKTGVFYNASAFQRSAAGFTTTEGTTEQYGPLSGIADQTAFVGELGLNANVSITRWLAWRAGYTLFWLSGVATAADQLKLADFGAGTATINTNGSVLLHGVTTGLEARW